MKPPEIPNEPWNIGEPKGSIYTIFSLVHSKDTESFENIIININKKRRGVARGESEEERGERPFFYFFNNSGNIRTGTHH